MANRPGYGRQQSQNDLMSLDDDDETPIYNSGQPPPISDERMLHDYDLETAHLILPPIHYPAVLDMRYHRLAVLVVDPASLLTDRGTTRKPAA